MTNSNNIINLHNFTAGAPINTPVKPLIIPASVLQTDAHQDMSDRYQFVSTADLIGRFESKGMVVRSAVQSRTRKEGQDGFQKHVVRLTMPDMKVGDTNPEIMIVNSHNGGSGLTFRLGLYRLVCSNGLMVGSDLGKVSVRHFGNNVTKIIEDALDDLHTQLPMVAETVEAMRARGMTDEEMFAFAQQVLAIRGCPKKAEELGNSPVLARGLLAARRNDDKAANLWEVYNRTQENVMRGQRGLRRINGVARDLEINKDLWNLAESYLKVA